MSAYRLIAWFDSPNCLSWSTCLIKLISFSVPAIDALVILLFPVQKVTEEPVKVNGYAPEYVIKFNFYRTSKEFTSYYIYSGVD